MAQGYNYDGAIELLKSLDNYDKDADIVAKIAGYEADKSTLVAVNMNEITHIFYHSLVVDPERGFAGNDSAAARFGVRTDRSDVPVLEKNQPGRCSCRNRFRRPDCYYLGLHTS